jgi:hypothetical protein
MTTIKELHYIAIENSCDIIVGNKRETSTINTIRQMWNTIWADEQYNGQLYRKILYCGCCVARGDGGKEQEQEDQRQLTKSGVAEERGREVNLFKNKMETM